MKIIEGSGEVPAIYSAHHASRNYGEFSDRVALNSEQRLRFSDYGTDTTVAQNGLVTLVAERSRALGDLNRNPDDAGRFQNQDYGKPTRHDIWLPGQELTEAEKEYCQRAFYDPYHNAIVDLLAERDSPTFVVAWDNTAHYEIGNDESGESVIMPPFILSNRGKEGTADPMDGEQASSDPEFITMLADYFREHLASAGLPTEVYLNLVYKGGYICRTYSTARNAEVLQGKGVTTEVQSLQLEYDTAITHNQETLAFDGHRARLLKSAFSGAMKLATHKYLHTA